MSVRDDLRIDGSFRELTVDAAGQGRVFDIGSFGIEPGESTTAPTVTLRGLTITGGSSFNGGAIFNLGTLTIEDCTITGNSAVNDGGALFNIDTGVVEIINSTITGNSAGEHGGAIFNADIFGVDGSEPPASEFDIELVLSDSFSPTQKALFEVAAARWERVIVGDVPDFFDDPVTPFFDPIDDVRIRARIDSIDGPGDRAASAGPRVFRGSGLPATGVMRFDSADLAGVEQAGDLLDLILHEMGHVLGIGRRGWNEQGLLDGEGGPDPRFTGPAGTREYNRIFGESGPDVPVEDVGPEGTRDAHWRKSVFGDEVMVSGADAEGPDPVSRVTVAALQDLGYVVNLAAADQFRPSGSGGPFPLLGGELTVTNSTIADNRAGEDGGGIFNAFGAETTVSGSELSRNRAGVGNNPDASEDGGGIFNLGTLTVGASGAFSSAIGSLIADNTADDHGGGIYNQGTAFIQGSTIITGNRADSNDGRSGSGGGVYNAGTTTVRSGSIISANEGFTGGGIFNAYHLTIEDSAISGNAAHLDGGGVLNEGSLTIRRSEISQNRAGVGDNPSESEDGGGIYSSGLLRITNSTVSGNRADDHGGGIYSEGAVEITNGTIVLNRADSNGGNSGLGGGIYQTTRGDGAVTLNNTIIAGNLAGKSGVNEAANDLSAEFRGQMVGSNNLVGDPSTSGFLDDDRNLIGDGSGGTLDLSTVLNPTLRNNLGGLTRTHALVLGSPAINAGDNSLLPLDVLDFDGDSNRAERVPFDQRRDSTFPRIAGTTVDIGAFEFQPPDLVFPGGPVPPLLVNTGATVTPFTGVTVTGDAGLLVVHAALSRPENGVLLPLFLPGFTDLGSGVYRLTGSAADVTAALRSLVFVPTENQVSPGQTVTTTFTLTADDGVNQATDSSIRVIATETNDEPTLSADSALVTVDEGQTATNGGTFADVDLGDAVTIRASVGTITQSAGGSGTWSWSFDAEDGPTQSQTVTITATDAFGGSSQVSFALVVNNVAPVIDPTTVSNTAVTVGDAGEGDAVTVTAAFSDAGTLDTHTATIDWGDGTVSAATVTESGGAGSLSGTHAYAQGGIYTVTITLTDDDAGEDQAQTVTLVTGVGLRDGTLFVIGTNGGDGVSLHESGGLSRQVTVHASFVGDFRTFEAAAVEEIVMLLGDGNDLATLAGNLDTPSIIDAGEGHDLVHGGRGPNVLVGGSGWDLLVGGHGRDLLIGGAGLDALLGGRGDDILIGGTTDFDLDGSGLALVDNLAALRAIRDEWNSAHGRADREANLTDGSGSVPGLNDGYFLTAGGTVHDDGAVDLLVGGPGLDWLFAFDSDLFGSDDND